MKTPSAADFDAFAAHHVPRLAQVADLLTGDRAAADELIVDALVLVYRRWARLGLSPDPLVGARRALTSTYLRSVGRPGRTDGNSALELADSDGTAPERTEGVEAVWEAVLDLSPRKRAVLVWSVFAGLPDGAVARTTAVLPLGVARTVRRALDQVGMTAGVGADYEIAGQPASRDRVAAEVAACFERHHRPQDDSESVLTQLRAATAGVKPRRSPSRTQQILAVTAAVIVLGGGAAALRWWPDQPTEQAQPAQPAQRTPAGAAQGVPTAPPGTRLVGYGAIAVAVPADWSRGPVGCAAEAPGTVILPGIRAQTAASHCGRRGAPATVTFGETDVVRADVLGVTTHGSVVDGRRLLSTEVYRLRGRYEQSVVVPEERLVLSVSAVNRATVTRIVQSVRAIPRGFTAVPDCLGERVGDATDLLVDAGLRPLIPQATELSNRLAAPPVTDQTVPAGTVVATGSHVGLRVRSF